MKVLFYILYFNSYSYVAKTIYHRPYNFIDRQYGKFLPIEKETGITFLGNNVYYCNNNTVKYFSWMYNCILWLDYYTRIPSSYNGKKKADEK